MPEAKKATAHTTKSKETDQNIKTIAALAYLIFFLPLLTNKDSKFAMYHANQGLLLLILAVAANFLLTFVGIATLGIGFLLWPIVQVGVLVLGIMGIMNAINGETKPLPLIGNFTILK